MNARKRWWGGYSLRKGEIAKLERVHANLWACLVSGTLKGNFSALWKRKETEGTIPCYSARDERDPPSHCKKVIEQGDLIEEFAPDASPSELDSDTWPDCFHCASMGIIEEVARDLDSNLLKSKGSTHLDSFLSGYEDEVDDWWEEINAKVRQKIEDDWNDTDNPFIPSLRDTISFILFNEGLREALDRYGPCHPDDVGDEISGRFRRCEEWLAGQEEMENLWVQLIMSNRDKRSPFNELTAQALPAKERAILYAIWMEEYHPQSRALNFLRRLCKD